VLLKANRTKRSRCLHVCVAAVVPFVLEIVSSVDPKPRATALSIQFARAGDLWATARARKRGRGDDDFARDGETAARSVARRQNGTISRRVYR